MDVYVQPVKIRVSCLPDEGEKAFPGRMSVYLEYRGDGEWVVTDGYEPREYLGPDGKWSYPPGMPDEQLTDEEFAYWRRVNEGWKARHRYSYDKALDIAKAEAPKRNIMGMNADTLMARLSKGLS